MKSKSDIARDFIVKIRTMPHGDLEKLLNKEMGNEFSR